MTIGIERRLSPEEEELAKKRDELGLLQVQLAERELHLANLRAELAAFEGRYLRQVGLLYAELDDWNAKLAELVADESGTEEAYSTATQARTRAAESRSSSSSAIPHTTVMRESQRSKRSATSPTSTAHP